MGLSIRKIMKSAMITIPIILMLVITNVKSIFAEITLRIMAKSVTASRALDRQVV
jgi:hypothetical protein